MNADVLTLVWFHLLANARAFCFGVFCGLIGVVPIGFLIALIAWLVSHPLPSTLFRDTVFGHYIIPGYVFCGCLCVACMLYEDFGSPDKRRKNWASQVDKIRAIPWREWLTWKPFNDRLALIRKSAEEAASLDMR
jgi:hypothetical protein